MEAGEPACACSHVLDEHDAQGKCTIDGCPWFAFEAVDEEES